MSNQLRSPTGSDSNDRRCGSQPNLSSPKLYQGSSEHPKITFRNKRKMQHEEQDFRQELCELQHKMDIMMNILTDFTSSQKDINSTISQKLETLIEAQSAMKSQLSGLENSTKDFEKKILALETEVKEIKTTTSIAPNCYEDIIHEIKERKERENNIILVGIQEVISENPQVRQNSDRNEVSKVVRLITKDGSEPTKVIRLGKYEANKHRPIKAFFHNPDVVKAILRNKRNTPLDNIKIYSDDTPYQQAHKKRLKEEIQKRVKNGESNLGLKYVKGIPKIVQLQAKNSKE